MKIRVIDYLTLGHLKLGKAPVSGRPSIRPSPMPKGRFSFCHSIGRRVPHGQENVNCRVGERKRLSTLLSPLCVQILPRGHELPFLQHISEPGVGREGGGGRKADVLLLSSHTPAYHSDFGG